MRDQIIKIYPNSCQKENGIQFCLGKIMIGDDFSETITPALNYWDIDDYQKQWQEGIERIKKDIKSCLVASIQNPYTSNPFLNWWLLYKRDNLIYLYNQMYVGKHYKKLTQNKPFTLANCYEFIPDAIINKDNEYSEWVIEYSDENTLKRP